MNDLVTRAREFARQKHATQLRRYTNEPYFVHLEEVAGAVKRAGLSENVIAAAWLHDVAEDQGVPIVEISATFNGTVAQMVLDLTDEPPSPGFNIASRKAFDRDRLSRASAETQSIKCADLISNTSTIVRHDPGYAKKYLPEKAAILEVLTKAHAGLRMVAWDTLRKAEDDLLQAALSEPEER